MRKLVYRPFRMVRDMAVRGSADQLRENFPNGKMRPVSGGQFETTYAKQAVINMPSEAEIAMFGAAVRPYALEIPQDPRGMDSRESGLARSVRTSMAAKDECERMIARQQAEEAERRAQRTAKRREAKRLLAEDDTDKGPMRRKPTGRRAAGGTRKPGTRGRSREGPEGPEETGKEVTTDE